MDQKILSSKNFQDLLNKLSDGDWLDFESNSSIGECLIEDQSSYYMLAGNRIFIGSREIGLVRNLPSKMNHLIPMKMTYSNSMKLAKNLFAQCLTEETSSNSPSMLLHQLASLAFGISLKFKTQWEERMGSYTPDLLIDSPYGPILVDVTSNNTKLKLDTMPKTMPCIALNKYAMTDYKDEFLQTISSWSNYNDSSDSDYIYNLIKEQFSGDMLYSERMLRFFSKDKTNDMLPILVHSKYANQALFQKFKDNLEDIKIINDDPNDVIMSEIKELYEELKNNDKFENDYFIFPRISLSMSEFEKKEEEHEAKYFMNDGFLDYGYQLDEEEPKHLLYEKDSKMIITDKAYAEMMNYPSDKNTKREYIKEYYKLALGMLGTHTAVWKHFFSNKIFEKLGINLDNPFQSKVNRVSTNFLSTQRIKLEKIDDLPKVCVNILKCEIDPDHHRFISQKGAADIIPYLQMSRDYHELRFKHRVAISIAYNKQPEKCFKVKHWKFSNLYALVKIKGLVLEKDKGVCYVSYFKDQSLIRTEKWRLSDIENYSVADIRFVTILTAFRKNINRKLKPFEVILIGRILAENSWGLSKFLKVYRYFSSGLCMSSTEIKDTLKKLVKSIDKPIKSKLSYCIILSSLYTKCLKREISYGKTPLFSLTFLQLGWESFLVNLCPSNTYGKNRHLEKTLTELSDEIDLFNSNYNLIKELFNDCEEIIRITDESLLLQKYSEHFSNLKKLSEITDGRFTFSPASLISMNLFLNDMKINFKSFQGSLPPLSELMTAKASTDSSDGRSTLAIESISSLAKRHKTTSTSLLSLSILNKLTKKKKIDFTMRMFDKDQVGGDREISILSSEFRILQVVAERFFEKWAKLTGIDKLHDSEKVQDLLKSYESAEKGVHKICLTADQTRWGPNFNTLIFGLMSCMMMPKTTEAYLPALICLLAEFKVFEMPIWLPNLFSKSDYHYTLLGKLGRNHMGQGIFHQSSSVYHSMVILSIRNSIIQMYKDLGYMEKYQKTNLNIDCFVTSDDLAIISYFSGGLKELKQEDLDDLNQMRIKIHLIMRNIYQLLILYGIKTSTYKNIISDKIEFNSIHLGDKGIANTDIKFCYSLLDPATTGNFLNDFNYTYDVYVDARNSMCTHETSVVISNACLIKMCRQWKINFKHLTFQKEEDLRMGLPKIYTKRYDENEKYHHLETTSNLRYKTRKAIEGKVDTGNEVLDEFVKLSLSRIKGSRERTAYRSILTFNKDNSFILNSYFFEFSGALGETYTMFLKETLLDTDHIKVILNKDYQTTFGCYPEDHETKEGIFKVMKLRDPITINVGIKELIASHYPAQKYLSHDLTELQLHLIRKYKNLEIIEPLFDFKETSFISAIGICDDKIREMEIQSTKLMVYDYKAEDKQRYTRYVYYPPSELKFLRKDISFSYCVNTTDLTDKYKYYPSLTVDLQRVSFDNGKLRTFREQFGRMIPNVKLSSKNIKEINYTNLLYHDFSDLFLKEQKYRNGKNVYLNIQLESKKLPERTPSLLSDDSKVNISEEFNAEDVMREFLEMDELSMPTLIKLVKEIEDKENDLEDDINEETKDVFSSLLSGTKNLKEMSVVSCEIDPKYGILCNSSYSLDIIVKDALIKSMEDQGIFYKQSWRKLDVIDWDSESIVYTFERHFGSKFNTLVHYSKTSLRQDNIKINSTLIKESILSILDGSNDNQNIFLFLLNGFSFVSFSEEPLGRLISSTKVQSLVLNM